MKKSKDSLGDRQKGYEAGAEDYLLPLVPKVARLDGRSFHSFTKGLNRPFDKGFNALMVATTKYLVTETQAVIGYTQSDEITLIYYSNTSSSQIFFNGKKSKMTSMLASMCSVFFNSRLGSFLPSKLDTMPLFDCRVFDVPTKTEAVNNLIWREADATRNSVSMAAHTYFSHGGLLGVSCKQMQERLFKEKNINWNDYEDSFKRGTYVQRVKSKLKYSPEEIDKLPLKHEARNNPNLEIERTEIKELKIPPLAKIVNRVGVIFEEEEPILKLTTPIFGCLFLA